MAETVTVAGGGAKASSRGSVMSSMLQRSPSRPSPESLTPPYGIASVRQVGTSLTMIPPTSSSSWASSVWSSDAVKTPHWRPKRLSLIAASASANESTAKRLTTGAKASSEQIIASRRHVDEHRRRVPAAVRLAGDEGAGAVADRIGHPSVRALDRLLVHHRPELGVGIQRIADLHALDALDEAARELVVDRAHDVDALDADAHLPGVGERAVHEALDRPVEVGGLVDDRPGIAAELEDDLLLAGLGLHLPADARRAGEARGA